jgi:hypothetical protein
MINTRPLRILILGIVMLGITYFADFGDLEVLVAMFGFSFCLIGGFVSDGFGASVGAPRPGEREEML